MKFALAKVSGKYHDNTGKLHEVTLEDVEVPQYESRDEFLEAAGSEEVELAFVNKAIANVAAQRARNSLTSSDKTTEDEKTVIANARKLARETVPTDRTRAGAGVKDRAEAGKELAERMLRGEKLSPDDVAKYAKLFGVAL